MSEFTIEPERSLTVRGLVMVTDPCYFLKDIWDDLVAAWYPPGNNHNGNELSEACVVEYQGARVLIGTTAYGDGTYLVRGAGTFGVDAGCMAVVQVDELLAAGLELVDDRSATFLDVGPSPVVVQTDGEGRFTGAVEVNTGDAGEDQDDGS